MIKDSFNGSKESKKQGSNKVLARKMSIFRQGSLAIQLNVDGSPKIVSSNIVSGSRVVKKMASVSDMKPE